MKELLPLLMRTSRTYSIAPSSRMSSRGRWRHSFRGIKGSLQVKEDRKIQLYPEMFLPSHRFAIVCGSENVGNQHFLEFSKKVCNLRRPFPHSITVANGLGMRSNEAVHKELPGVGISLSTMRSRSRGEFTRWNLRPMPDAIGTQCYRSSGKSRSDTPLFG